MIAAVAVGACSYRALSSFKYTPLKEDRFQIYGQEANPDTWKMAIMILRFVVLMLILVVIMPTTFTKDLHPTLKADFILANPPFNYNPWGQDKLMDDVRWKYGLPPANNANFAWIQHMIHHLAPNGKIGLVLANGALSPRLGARVKSERRIIEDDLIEGIIAMPPQLFYSVTIPATLWFISKGKNRKARQSSLMPVRWDTW